MIEETEALLDLWEPGMTVGELNRAALDSGCFPSLSARRLRNLVNECFAPRLLGDDGKNALLLKTLRPVLSIRAFEQLLFVYTCRANDILSDFVRQIYWPAYCAGQENLSNKDARLFVQEANHEGRTTTTWAAKTVQNVAGYLTGACAEFGLLERSQKTTRRILRFRLEPLVAIALAYDLHFSGMGDNTVVGHADWALLGMEREDVVKEMMRHAMKGVFLFQKAGDTTRISWPCKNPKELSHAIA